jgi:signal transduction histidine kinase
MWRLTGGISGRDLLEDGIHGVIVYAVMGAAIYIFRRGREEMMARVAELRTLETIGQLAADLAHDFNNTLQVVTGTAQLLTRNASLDRAAARDVRNILSAGEQGMALTREMMNLVRPPSPDPVACDLSQTVDQQMKLLHRVLPTTIQLVREYAAEPLPVRLSAGMSYRILVNLCLNARSAMSGGGLLTLRTSRRQVGRRDFAVLEVVDTGTGIDPRLVRSALSAFPLPWRKTSAVGLGIRIVRSITELHGGHVSFHGEPGKGTTVTVCFPLQPMDAQSVAAAEEPAFAGEAR